MRTCIVIPIKTINKRLPGKTFKSLGGKPLYAHLFDTVKDLGIDVYVDSSDERVLKTAKEYGFETFKRPERYNEDDIAGDDLFKRVIDRLDYDLIGALWITGPFLTGETIKKSISIMEKEESLDSLFGITPKYNRFWYKNSPVNHDLANLARTQDLIPVYEEANFQFVRKSSFIKYGKYTCGKFKTVEVNEIEAVDIDTLTDFLYAEAMINAGLVKLGKDK